MGRQGRRSVVGLMDMSILERRAYWIYKGQEKRNGVRYSWEEFRDWYLKEFKKRKWKRAHVARKDHDQPYSFENVELQEQAENNRERNNRRGNPAKTKSVTATCVFRTKKDAAKFFGVSDKTVYNHCQSRTAKPFKFGPRLKNLNGLRFKWNT